MQYRVSDNASKAALGAGAACPSSSSDLGFATGRQALTAIARINSDNLLAQCAGR
jgi:hypothetical protein